MECCFQWHLFVLYQIGENEWDTTRHTRNAMHQWSSLTSFTCLFNHISDLIKIFRKIRTAWVLDGHTKEFGTFIGQRRVGQLNGGIHNELDVETLECFGSHNRTGAAEKECGQNFWDSKIEGKLCTENERRWRWNKITLNKCENVYIHPFTVKRLSKEFVYTSSAAARPCEWENEWMRMPREKRQQHWMWPKINIPIEATNAMFAFDVPEPKITLARFTFHRSYIVKSWYIFSLLFSHDLLFIKTRSSAESWSPCRVACVIFASSNYDSLLSHVWSYFHRPLISFRTY